MNILVTGANGFVGKNLVATLKQNDEYTILPYTRNSSENELNEYTQKADFVFHLAGVNRPENEEEFKEGNTDFTATLLNKLVEKNNKAPILITSTIQAELDNPYGKSKKAAEDLIFEYGRKNNVKTFVYRLPNLFGKWSKPNYNTVIATFCHKVARDEEITVNDPNVELTLAYIDDVIEEFMDALNDKGTKTGDYYEVPVTYTKKLGHIADLIQSFKETRKNRFIPNMNDSFTKKLYSTYLNFLPEDDFSYPLVMHEDERGHFTEFVKSEHAGQVSINVSKPGIEKGDHWHHTKNEKFLVVSGKGVIKFRDPHSDKVIEYNVSGEKLEVVDIPTGYTHSIVNVGETDMVTVMWVNEPFDPANPGTYPLEV